MPSNPISFTEAMKLVEDSENLDDPRLQDFISRVEDMAISILREKDDSYLAGAVSLMQSVALTSILTDTIPDLDPKIKLLWGILMSDDSFAFICAMILKMTIGLAAYEELR